MRVTHDIGRPAERHDQLARVGDLRWMAAIGKNIKRLNGTAENGNGPLRGRRIRLDEKRAADRDRLLPCA